MDITTVVENQMDKKMESDMETEVLEGFRD